MINIHRIHPPSQNLIPLPYSNPLSFSDPPSLSLLPSLLDLMLQKQCNFAHESSKANPIAATYNVRPILVAEPKRTPTCLLLLLLLSCRSFFIPRQGEERKAAAHWSNWSTKGELTLPLISLFHVKAQLIPEAEEEEEEVRVTGTPRLFFDATSEMISDEYNLLSSEP